MGKLFKRLFFKKHKHQWEYLGYIVLRGKFLRLIERCKTCGIAVHSSVYTLKQLERAEEEEEEEE